MCLLYSNSNHHQCRNTAAETIPPPAEIVTSPVTVLQTPFVIEPAPAKDVISLSSIQPVVTTITIVTLPIFLPIQTVSRPLQTVGGSIVLLIPTDDSTVQILSLDAHLTELLKTQVAST